MKHTLPTCHLRSWDLANKRVLLRADLNVPLNNGIITDDFKLQAIRPTIDFILAHGGSVILATHLGRPKTRDQKLSTHHLVAWFAENFYPIHFESDLEKAYTQSKKLSSSILLLENLRFFPGEQSKDPHFAQQLARLGDVFVNDAFGTMHRDDASISQVPLLFEPARRSIGLLVEKELSFLTPLRAEPQQPFVVLLGGGKLPDKIPLIKSFVGKAETILVGPALSNTFMKAAGKNIGKSIFDESELQTCQEIMAHAEKKGTHLVLPIDFQIADDATCKNLRMIEGSDIPDNAIAVSIGPETIKLFGAALKKGGTIFSNGLIGFLARPESLASTQELFAIMSKTGAKTIIGGGDSVAVARKMNLEGRLSFLSTGGGATTTYLSGQQMPGLDALKDEPN